jgi:hypothetical protein
MNPEGTTPIDPDEAQGLIPSHIRTQTELDAWEQTNIIEGLAWAERQSRRELLDDSFVRECLVLLGGGLGVIGNQIKILVWIGDIYQSVYAIF